ncbi:uncharacterized protein LOC100115618 isoform X2 [Nasonia vitripennis]|uniref:DNA helicase Pif1-like 2B domain-containing protein n=1 Tax=Nasonia vitripennis TaxID=7425 RepID=A0A7M7T8A1_NASVI|nr:uncharacterized protein LOC100115618 isoform X2 [Nasonia vitripennis]XP_031781877.1 uncharacterized protein LOC100115618 isoform X2 [Nasonia vitripennis]
MWLSRGQPIDVNAKISFPVHKLTLEKSTIVMLIQNISINDSLCNSTRLKIIKLFKHNIKAEIITGDKKGTTAFIPRIILDTGKFSGLLGIFVFVNLRIILTPRHHLQEVKIFVRYICCILSALYYKSN